MNSFRRNILSSPLLLGAGAALVVNAVGALLVLLNHYLLAQSIGAAGVGLYSYAISWAGLVALVSVLGVDSVVIAQGSRLLSQPGKLRGLFAWASRDVLLGTLLAVVLYLSVVILKKWQTSVMLAAAPLIVFLAAGFLRQGMLRALKRPALARFPDIVLRPSLFGLFLVGAVFAGRELGAAEALVLHSVAAFVAFIFGLLLVRRLAPKSSALEITGQEVLAWRKAASRFFLITWAGVTFQELDLLLAGSFLGAEQAGLYATALRLAAFIPFGAQACDAALAPLISEKYGKGEPIGALVQRALLWNILLAIVPAVILLVWGSAVLGFFGTQFVQAGQVLLILTLGQFVAVLLGPSGFVLSMTNQQGELAKIYTIWMVAALILGVILVKLTMQAEVLALVISACLILRSLHGAVLCSRKLKVSTSILGLLVKR